MRATTKQSASLFLALAMMLGLLGWILGGANTPLNVEAVENGNVAATTIFSKSQEPAPSPASVATRLPLVPGTFESGVQALQFQFAQGRLVLRGQQTVPGAVRRSRFVGGKSGLYHRLVDATGRVLFEGLAADPRVMHYDYTDDGRSLKGGVAVQEETPFQLRLPAGLSGSLEVYLARSASLSPAAQATPENLLAQVSLP